MITLKYVLYAILCGSAYLLTITVVLHVVEKWLKLTSVMPRQFVESVGIGWTLMNFVTESVFYVLIPTMAYSFFYFVIPFSGLRAGLAAALFAFVIGAVPLVIGLTLRVKIPALYLLWVLLSHLLKLGGSLAVIGWLYTV